MKQLKIYTLILAGLLAFITSCKDDSIELVPKWESAVHGLGNFASGSSASFVYNQPATDVDLELQWISIDGKASVNKIEVYVLVNESYVDAEGNEKVAMHGGEKGKLYKSFEGGGVPGNRTPVTFSLDQASLYTLYQDAQFNYGNGTVSVFSNPDKPERNTTNRFIPDDAISARWEFTTTDGRVISKWGPSVCTEFPGANCSVDFGVVCNSDLGGTFDYLTTNIQCDNCPPTYPGVAGCLLNAPIEGNGELVALGGGKYTVSDATFGQYGCAWDDNPAKGVTLNDVCDKVQFGGADQYGLVYTFSIVSNDGTTLTIDWQNDYGDSGRTALTRTDGKTWPLTLYN